MKKSIIIFYMVLLVLFSITTLRGQKGVSTKENKVLNVYIEHDAIDNHYLKEIFTIVNYVSDPVISDVQILINILKTGSGGNEYNLIFLGNNGFAYLNDTVTFHIHGDATTEKSRFELLEKIKLGLVPFLMKTSYADKLKISVDSCTEQMREESDPWRNWMFEVSGSASLYNRQLSKTFDILANLYLYKITHEIKFESLNQYNYGECHYIIPISNNDFYHINMFYNSIYSGNLIVKSLGEHFSAGAFINFRKNQASNIDFQMRIGPAFEYNLFKYKDAATKQCRFLYSINYVYNNYTDLTINNKMNDRVITNNLNLMFKSINKWGDFSASLNGSCHLDDISCFIMGAGTCTRIFASKGLSFDMSLGINLYSDQMDQRNGFATSEEILTNQKEIESSYDYSIKIGITYRFGSIYNNAVNPRFE